MTNKLKQIKAIVGAANKEFESNPYITSSNVQEIYEFYRDLVPKLLDIIVAQSEFIAMVNRTAPTMEPMFDCGAREALTKTESILNEINIGE